MAHESLNDPALIRRAQNGNDKDAMDALFACCFAYSYMFSRLRKITHEDSEDIAQAVTINLSRSLQDIDPERGLKGWVRTVSRNVWVSSGRKKHPTSLDMGPGSDAAVNLPSREPDPSQPEDERLARLLSALEQLPPPQREIVVRQYFEGQKLDDIAQSLGVQVTQVYHQTARARAYLRRVLNPNVPEAPEQPET